MIFQICVTDEAGNIHYDDIFLQIMQARPRLEIQMFSLFTEAVLIRDSGFAAVNTK